MNYEELLETRDVRKTTKVRMPYGYFYKRLIDGKYSNFVEFHDEVADAITFSSSVKTEHEALAEIHSKHQLHFTPNEGDDGVYAIAVEVGNFVTIEQLLNENPSYFTRVWSRMWLPSCSTENQPTPVLMSIRWDVSSVGFTSRRASPWNFVLSWQKQRMKIPITAIPAWKPCDRRSIKPVRCAIPFSSEVRLSLSPSVL